MSSGTYDDMTIDELLKYRQNVLDQRKREDEALDRVLRSKNREETARAKIAQGSNKKLFDFVSGKVKTACFLTERKPKIGLSPSGLACNPTAITHRLRDLDVDVRKSIKFDFLTTTTTTQPPREKPTGDTDNTRVQVQVQVQAEPQTPADAARKTTMTCIPIMARGQFTARLQRNIAQTQLHFASPIPKLENGCGARGAVLKMYPHQEFIPAFVNPYTNYNLLVWHSTGSGKTAVMVGLCAVFREEDMQTPIVVIAPAKNVANFYEDVVKGYGKMEFRATRPSLGSKDMCNKLNIYAYSYRKFANRLKGEIARALDTAPGKDATIDNTFPLRVHIVDSAGTSLLVKRGTGSNAKHIFEHPKTGAAVTTVHYKVVSKKTKANSKFEKATGAGSEQEGRCMLPLIIFDEAHNLAAKEIKKEGDERQDSLAIKEAYNMLKYNVYHEHARVVLMTATPIKYDVMELAKLLDLLLTRSSNPSQSSENKFSKMFKRMSKNVNMKLLAEKCRGLVSYYDASGDTSRFARLVTGANLSTFKDTMDAQLFADATRVFAASTNRWGIIPVEVSDKQFEKWKSIHVDRHGNIPQDDAEDVADATGGDMSASSTDKKRDRVRAFLAYRDALFSKMRSADEKAYGTLKDVIGSTATDTLSTELSESKILLLRDNLQHRLALLARYDASSPEKQQQGAAATGADEGGLESVCKRDGSDPASKLRVCTFAGMTYYEKNYSNKRSNFVTLTQACNVVKEDANRVVLSASEYSERYTTVPDLSEQQPFFAVDGDTHYVYPLIHQCFYNGKSIDQLLSDAADGFSCKLHALLTNVTQIRGKHFVFTSSTPAYGTTAIAAALVCAGFVQISFARDGNAGASKSASKSSTKSASENMSDDGEETKVKWQPQKTAPGKKTFILLPTETNDDLLNAMLAFFNSASNSDGSMCCCLIANKSYNQGISLFDVNWMHLLDSPVDMTTREQAIARTVRNCGHTGLGNVNRWFTFVLNYAAAKKGVYLSDVEILVKSVAEYASFEQIIEGVKQSSIDYGMWSAIPGNL